MKTYSILGLMSGTSLDGLDLAHCQFSNIQNKWEYKIVAHKSIPYSEQMRTGLRDAIFLKAEDLLHLNNSYGTWLGEQAKIFIDEHRLEVDAVSSHGHTTHHRPDKGLTYQIGSGQHLANACGIKVICDFRTNDVALGGQGAPLVPIGDQLLFGKYDFCLNLGGISNISFDLEGKRIAYDIGLANMILNHITRKIALDFDLGGALARKGRLNVEMLSRLNQLEFYRLPPPKSIGYEWFVEKVVPIVDDTNDTPQNLLRTAVVHICEKIGDRIRHHQTSKGQTLLVTGGGALNDFLIETLRQQLGEDTKVVVPPRLLIEYKEALIFALMGALRLAQRTNVFASVTGAKRDSSSGVLYLPN
jgi:anhydro-N-acetylmuramic acid kinase